MLIPSLRKSCLALLLVLVQVSFVQVSFGQSGQSADRFGRLESDTIKAAYWIDATTLRENILSAVSPDIPDLSWTAEAYRFSEETSLSLAELLVSGDIYSNWPELEAYVNAILQKVIPPELQDDTLIHAYIIKDGTFNAFMTASGMTFVNIGIFAHIEDEASIAAILAHELAHYYKNHHFKRYVKALQGEFRPKLFVRNRAASKFSIENELEADELAIKWLAASGYNLEGLTRNFHLSHTMEQNEIDRHKELWEIEETTHPLSDRRLELFEASNEEQETKGENFLVSEEQFNTFKQEAKVEILKHLLASRAYAQCIETGFKFHIMEPSNPSYLYYLMEGIRRRCYLNPTLWNKNFITERYYEVVEGDRIRTKVKSKRHLFDGNPLNVILMSKQDKANIEAKFYWQETKFTTNAEAFDFFFEVSKLLDEPECILSFALSIVGYDSIQASFLEQYLDKPDIRFRNYAESLLNKSARKDLGGRKLVVLQEFQVKQSLQGTDMLVYNYSSNFPILEKLATEVAGSLDNRTSLHPESIKQDQVRLYRALSELHQYSLEESVSMGRIPDLHIISPEYWEVFMQLGVHEIEFVHVYYIETRAEEPSLEAYKAIRDLPYQEIFDREVPGRYIEIYISSVRDVSKGALKLRYYGGNLKLTKKPAFDQLTNQIQAAIRMKVRRGAELDRGNR